MYIFRSLLLPTPTCSGGQKRDKDHTIAPSIPTATTPKPLRAQCIATGNPNVHTQGSWSLCVGAAALGQESWSLLYT